MRVVACAILLVVNACSPFEAGDRPPAPEPNPTPPLAESTAATTAAAIEPLDASTDAAPPPNDGGTKADADGDDDDEKPACRPLELGCWLTK